MEQLMDSMWMCVKIGVWIGTRWCKRLCGSASKFGYGSARGDPDVWIGNWWITGILVWIGGMDRPVGSGYGSGFYILTRSHVCCTEMSCRHASKQNSKPGNRRLWSFATFLVFLSTRSRFTFEMDVLAEFAGKRQVQQLSTSCAECFHTSPCHRKLWTMAQLSYSTKHISPARLCNSHFGEALFMGAKNGVNETKQVSHLAYAHLYTFADTWYNWKLARGCLKLEFWNLLQFSWATFSARLRLLSWGFKHKGSNQWAGNPATIVLHKPLVIKHAGAEQEVNRTQAFETVRQIENPTNIRSCPLHNASAQRWFNLMEKTS